MRRTTFIWTDRDLSRVCGNYIFLNDILPRGDLIEKIRMEISSTNDYRLSGCFSPSSQAIEMKIRACEHLDTGKRCSSKQLPTKLHYLIWDEYLTSHAAQLADKYGF
jgi:hypothetical protein